MDSRFPKVILLFLLLYLHGCSMPIFGPYYEEKVQDLAALLDPFEGSYFIVELPPVGEDLYVFACSKASPQDPFVRLFSFLFDPALVAAECGIYKATDTVMEKIENKELIPRAVDIGFGNTLIEFHEAAQLCNNSPRYAVSYIYGEEAFLKPPRKPFISSQTCLAYRSIMPVYVFTTPDGKAPPTANEGEIASLLSSNPSIVVYLHNTRETPSVLKQRLSLIRNNCPRCLIALGVPFNDPSLAQAVREDPLLDSLVDLMAFGVDTRFTSARDATTLYGETLMFVGLLKSLTNKPVFIYYTYLEGMPDYERRVFYNRMVNSLHTEGSTGLLGYVPEAFYDRSSPTGKENTGLVSDQGTEWQKRFSMVFSLCRLYYTAKPPLAFFSPTGIKALGYAHATDPFATSAFSGLPADEGEPPYYISIGDKDEAIFDCNPCVGERVKGYLTSLGISPFSISPSECEEGKVKAAYYASRIYFDPAAVMALRFFTSSPCEAEYVPSFDTDRCDYPLLSSKASSPTCSLPVQRYNPSTGSCSIGGSGSECYVCQYGPLSVPYPPAPYAPSIVELVCGEDFDPYTEEDAYCGASVALSSYYSLYEETFSLSPYLYYIQNEEERQASALAMAALRYFEGKKTAEEFLLLVEEVGHAQECDTLTSEAYYFCCDGSSDEPVNSLCGAQRSPVEVMVELHRNTPPTTGAQKWAHYTESVYRYLTAYVSVAESCKVCDKEGAMERYCEKAEDYLGYDPCSTNTP